MTEESEKYEEFIKELIENIKKCGREINELNYGKQNKIVGASG